MKLAIHYMKPEWFAAGIMGVGRPDPADLAATHVLLMEIELARQSVEKALEDTYRTMQGEVWSPNGEARDLIEGLGLRHTSMSVGDVMVADGQVFIVASFGFERLEAGR
jgi:hypothetical protein